MLEGVTRAQSILVALLGLGLGCDNTAPAADTADAPEAHEAKSPEPPPNAEPPARTEPPAEAEPPPPSFDPLTARAARIRVVVVHDRYWSPCGIIHSVGAIEVEVLDAGEPPPRMLLHISCPADVGHDVLAVGKILDVELHAREQPWPRPTGELPEHLPVRYVASLAEAEPAKAPPSPQN